MTVSNARRLELYDKMRQAIGDEPAATLMEILPPMDATDIATRHDVDHATIVLRGEMTELRSELRGEMAELRSELRGEMAEIRGEIAELRGAVVAQFGEFRGEFKASTRHSMITIIAAAVTIWLTFYVPSVI